MKTPVLKFLFLFVFIISCKSQELPNQRIDLTYKAQTRGFVYEVSLLKNSLKIITNEGEKVKLLTNEDLETIKTQLKTINFKKIKSNISTSELAVDKAILGNFYIWFESTTYMFEFNHANLPLEIKELLTNLEKI